MAVGLRLQNLPQPFQMAIADGRILAQPSSVAFWYADEPPLPELSQFEWVVVEPGHVSASDLAYLKAQGRTVFAYLSVGEYQGDLTAAGLQDAASSIRNSAWNSQVMDLEASAWRDYLLGRASALKGQGYDGVFLDTLDSFHLQPKAFQEPQRLARRYLRDGLPFACSLMARSMLRRLQRQGRS